jgi:hypothetical protein
MSFSANVDQGIYNYVKTISKIPELPLAFLSNLRNDTKSESYYESTVELNPIHLQFNEFMALFFSNGWGGGAFRIAPQYSNVEAISFSTRKYSTTHDKNVTYKIKDHLFKAFEKGHFTSINKVDTMTRIKLDRDLFLTKSLLSFHGTETGLSWDEIINSLLEIGDIYRASSESSARVTFLIHTKYISHELKVSCNTVFKYVTDIPGYSNIDAQQVMDIPHTHVHHSQEEPVPEDAPEVDDHQSFDEEKNVEIPFESTITKVPTPPASVAPSYHSASRQASVAPSYHSASRQASVAPSYHSRALSKTPSHHSVVKSVAAASTKNVEIPITYSKEPARTFIDPSTEYSREAFYTGSNAKDISKFRFKPNKLMSTPFKSLSSGASVQSGANKSVLSGAVSSKHSVHSFAKNSISSKDQLASIKEEVIQQPVIAEETSGSDSEEVAVAPLTAANLETVAEGVIADIQSDETSDSNHEHEELMDEVKSISSAEENTIVSSNSLSSGMVREVSNLIMSGQSVAASTVW